MGVLTGSDRNGKGSYEKFQSSTSRHGGTDPGNHKTEYVVPYKFQSSTSRHGGTDFRDHHHRDRMVAGFNPLHRGMGVLTQVTRLSTSQPEKVSILYIEAWGY